MSERSDSSWQDRLLSRIKAQPARAAVLTILLAVMGVLWVRHFSGGGSAKPASAARTVGPQPVAVGAGKGAENVSRAAAALKDFLQRPPATIRRNFFAVKMEHFPMDGSKATAGDPEGQGFWDELAKSLAAKADQEKARRILLGNLKEQAGKLRVQMIMMSNGSPRALVDGKLVIAGDVVGGFKISSIEADRIIIEREGVSLVIGSGLNK